MKTNKLVFVLTFLISSTNQTCKELNCEFCCS